MRQVERILVKTARSTWKKVSATYRVSRRDMRDMNVLGAKAVLLSSGVPWETGVWILERTYLSNPDNMRLRHQISEFLLRTTSRLPSLMGYEYFPKLP